MRCIDTRIHARFSTPRYILRRQEEASAVVRRASLAAVPAAGAGGTEAEAPIARAARAMPLLSCAGVVCAVVGGAVGARDHRVDGPASDWLWLCLFGGACLPTAQVSSVGVRIFRLCLYKLCMLGLTWISPAK
jgi:hypothetical protein